MRFYILIFSFLFLAACTTLQKIDTAYDKTTQARVRAIKGAHIHFYPNQECSSRTLLGIGDKGYAASGGFFNLFETNKTIGIPLLKDTPPRFVEHVVTANQSLTIEASYIQQEGNVQFTCGPVIGTFTPAPGGDYEAKFVLTGGTCKLNIREIVSEREGYKAVPVHFKRSSRCKS